MLLHVGFIQLSVTQYKKPTGTQETNYHIKDQIVQKQRSQFVDIFCVRVGTRMFRFSVYINN